MIKTTIISVDEAIKNGWEWGHHENDCEFKGEFPGYVCGWSVQVRDENTGKIGYCSMVCTNDFEEIRDPYTDENWNELGISADCCKANIVATGNIVFRGYWEEHYDWYDREEYVTPASKEVMNLFDKYCVA